MRYGVLADLARRVWNDETIDVSMGHVNVIWQADANAMSIQALSNAASPPFILNVAGPEILSVREICQRLANRMNKTPRFVGEESGTSLLNNGQMGHRTFGPPQVSIETLIEWTADWISRGGASLDKPTHFETRSGKF
jgi:nucleoside-diphosphate-sugar epimerase